MQLRRSIFAVLAILIINVPVYALEEENLLPYVTLEALDTEFNLIVSMSAPKAAILNQETQNPYSMRSRAFARPSIKVAGEKFYGSSAAVKAKINGKKAGKVRIMTFHRDYVPASDGAIGATALPRDEIIIYGNAPQTGHKELKFSLVEKRGGLRHLLSVGDDNIEVRFAFEESISKMNTAAAAILLNSGLATRSNTYTDQEVAFGVHRPMEPLNLHGPLLDRPLNSILSRISYARAEALGTNYKKINDPDEDVIVVVGTNKKKLKNPYIRLGRDWLEGCSYAKLYKADMVLSVFCG